ncbi:transposase [Streptomyces sp. NPDC127051]|uniref:transposase n=1 Tax=Streptomyces sp. NPDC127051 TaxID=3347119 RepID=UPI00364BF281
MRAALEALAAAAPSWLAGQVDVTEFAERYGPRTDGWRMPSSQTKCDRLAQVFGQDALALCRAAWSEDAPAWIREIEAVGLLRQVLVQTHIIRSDARGQQVIRKRDAYDGVPPGQLRLASPYDADAHWAAKGDHLFWLGYKIHLTETCGALPEAEAGRMPNLITDVHTSDATVPDVRATALIQQSLVEHAVKPAEHYLDSGYPSADLITKALQDGIRMVTPVLLDLSAQAKAAEGFEKNAFTIDWKTRQVRCPAGRTSSHWNPVKQHGKDAIVITFSVLACRDCPFQQQCTTSERGRRMLTLRPEELHETLARARTEQKTDTWKNKYALRAGAEGTINQALDTTGIRRARYRGLPKVRLQHAFSATALNIIRLDAHWTNSPLRPARTSQLQRLGYPNHHPLSDIDCDTIPTHRGTTQPFRDLVAALEACLDLNQHRPGINATRGGACFGCPQQGGSRYFAKFSAILIRWMRIIPVSPTTCPRGRHSRDGEIRAGLAAVGRGS